MSQMNRNAAYIYEVDGITVWERLRVIRNFLRERIQAHDLAVAKHEHTRKEMDLLDKNDIKRIEFDIMKEETLDIIDDAKNEIEFLKDFESKLAAEAEPLRIEGKTDKEMYELNFFEEQQHRLVIKSQSEIMTIGSVSPETMENLLKHRPALNELMRLGLIGGEALDLIPLHNMKTNLLEIGYDK